MSYTRNQIVTLLSEIIGDKATGTATGGAAGGGTLTTTDLLRQPGARYSSQFCEMTGGTYSGNVRLINTGVVSAGTLTLTPYNAFGGTITAGDTFAVHRFDPNWKAEGVNEALRDMGALIPIVVREDIVTGECLRNGHMGYWRDSATPYDWTPSGTVTRETTIVYTGDASLKMASGAAATVKQPVYLSRELYGLSVNLTAYAYQSTADSGTRLRLTQGNTNTDGTGLSASGSWTQLSVSLTVTDTSDPIYATLVQGNTANATYWGEARLLVPASSAGYVNWVPLSDYYGKLRQFYMGGQHGRTDKTALDTFCAFPMPRRQERGLLFFDYELLVPYKARLVGTGRYPNLTAGTDTIDINQEEAQLLASIAGIKVLDKARGYESPEGQAYLEAKKKDLATQIGLLQDHVWREVPSLHLASMSG